MVAQKKQVSMRRHHATMWSAFTIRDYLMLNAMLEMISRYKGFRDRLDL